MSLNVTKYLTKARTTYHENPSRIEELAKFLEDKETSGPEELRALAKQCFADVTAAEINAAMVLMAGVMSGPERAA